MLRWLQIIVILGAMCAVVLPGRQIRAQERCFNETEYCIAGEFGGFWFHNGGLPVFGFPIAVATNEPISDSAQARLTQWFERYRYERHPEQPAPYDVLLGRIGDEALRALGVDWQTLPRDAGPQPSCLWFEQTGHNVCDQAPGLGFKSYWQGHGLSDSRLSAFARSLALFGLPLTEARVEINTSGERVLTQWFERARFEWHPDNRDQYKVLLGLLGNELHGGGGLTAPPSYRMDGLNFGPFTGDQDPTTGAAVDEQQLLAHLQRIRRYTEWIRTFGCGNGLEQAGRIAHEMNLKIAVGAALTGDPAHDQDQLACLIGLASAGEADAVVVGNDVLRSGSLSEAQLVAYIEQVQQAAPNEIPVTTVDAYNLLLDHPAVVAAVDEVYVTYYPFFAGTQIDGVAGVLQAWHDRIMALAAGKRVVVAESGWPSCGESEGEAIASLLNARSYALQFLAWARAANVQFFYFEAFDEPWKRNYDGERGACWGLWDKDGRIKPGMHDLFWK